jgi:hypothetical protein
MSGRSSTTRSKGRIEMDSTIRASEIATLLADLDRIAEESDSEDGWHSTAALAEARGASHQGTLALLKKAQRAGAWECRRVVTRNCVGELTKQIRWRPVTAGAGTPG